MQSLVGHCPQTRLNSAHCTKALSHSAMLVAKVRHIQLSTANLGFKELS